MRKRYFVNDRYCQVQFWQDGKQVGWVSYDMAEGSFSVIQWPAGTPAAKKIAYLISVLSLARKVVHNVEES